VTNFTQEEERFQWLHELQVLIGIGFEPAQGVFLVLHRKKVAISDHRIDSLLAEYANTRVQQRHMPRFGQLNAPPLAHKQRLSKVLFQ